VTGGNLASRRQPLETAKGGVFEQQSLLLALIGEEDPHDPPRLHSKDNAFAEPGVEHPVARRQTCRRDPIAGG
jgi:hypothetical protein